MTVHRMQLGDITYDDSGAGSITIRLRPLAPATAPSPPEGVDPSNWFPQAGSEIEFVAPARKLPDVTLYGVAITPEPSAPGGVAYYRYTLKNGTWTDRIRVNTDGKTPYTPPT